MLQQILSKKKISFRSVLCFLFLLFYLSVVNNNIYGQVTIGSGNPPAKGALLDLKENEAPGGDITSTKGIIFPRVNLTDLTSLVPLLSTADASDATQKTTHRGTIVYNVAVTANLTEGLYCWDGTKWVRVSSAGNEAWLTQGNAQTDTTRNFLGTTDNQALTFKVNNVRAGMLSSIDGFTNATAFGYKALSGGSTGEANNAFGFQALKDNTTGAGNSAFGLNALAGNKTGGNNTAMGNRALANSTGDSNTAVGSLTLTKNTSGVGNTAVGQTALSANETGSNNTAVGVMAMVNTTTGGNTAVGANALGDNVSGGDNTAVGYYALKELGTGGNSAGSKNTAIGHSAGSLLTLGSNNILVGANTSVKDNTDNQMNIGNTLFGTGMNGTLTAPAGSIGIRTATPSSTLTVNGSYAGKYTYINGPYAVTESDYNIVLGRGGSGNSRYTVTLPAKSDAAGGTFPGREYHFKNISETDTMVVTVGNASTERIRLGGAGLADVTSRIVPPGAYARVVSADWPYSTSVFPTWDWFYTTNMIQGWSTRGNAATDTLKNFIGTTDNNGVNIRTNGVNRIHISKDIYPTGGNIQNLAANGGVGILAPGATMGMYPTSSLVVDGSFAGRTTYIPGTSAGPASYIITHTDYNITLRNSDGHTTPRKIPFQLPGRSGGGGNFAGREYYIKNSSDVDTINVVTSNNEYIRFGGVSPKAMSRILLPGGFARIVATDVKDEATVSWDWDYTGQVNQENIKTMAYAKTTASPIGNNTPNDSRIVVGNLMIRYNGTSDSSAGYIEVATLVQTHYSYIYHKAGMGNANIEYYGQDPGSDTVNYWQQLNWQTSNGATEKPANFNPGKRDLAVLTIVLHNTKEVYRATFNANGAIGVDGSIPATQSAVTIFVERLQ